MNQTTTYQILTIIDTALEQLKTIREAQEGANDKMEIVNIEGLLAEANGLALEALTRVRGQ